VKYMGSKARYAKYILPLILKDRKPNQWYVEPFVGGANIIDKVDGNRIGNDINEYLIKMWKSLQMGWVPPNLITEEQYKDIRINKKKYEPNLVGYVGFNLSFGGKWFGGYRRNKIGQEGLLENMKFQSEQALRSILKQVPKIKNIKFYNKNYLELEIPNNSIIYCDIPYFGTTKYKNKFNHNEFWIWADQMVLKGHKVFVSEYSAPNNWICIWEKQVFNSLTKNTGGKIGTEKLFTKNL
jgi:DNA adenine methylase